MTAAASSPPGGSPSGSPPGVNYMDAVPPDHLPTVAPDTPRLTEVANAKLKALSDVASAKLRDLTEFLPNANPSPLDQLVRDQALCAALNEIDPRILVRLGQKALSTKALLIILAYCNSLQTLNLAGFHQITDAALPRIAEFSQLTYLNLTATAVTDLEPLIKKPLQHLTTVNFFSTAIPSKSLIAFLQCHKICHLTLPKNPPKGFFTAIPVEHLRDVTVHLDNSSVNEDILDIDEILTVLGQNPSLQKLKIWIQRTITDRQICNLVIRIKNLRSEVTLKTDYFTFTISPRVS